MITGLFLGIGLHMQIVVVGLPTQVGRLYMVEGSQIFVVTNHKVIRATITNDVEMFEVIRGIPINLRQNGFSTPECLGILRGIDLSTGDMVYMARLYYLKRRLIRVDIWQKERGTRQ